MVQSVLLDGCTYPTAPVRPSMSSLEKLVPVVGQSGTDVRTDIGSDKVMGDIVERMGYS